MTMGRANRDGISRGGPDEATRPTATINRYTAAIVWPCVKKGRERPASVRSTSGQVRDTTLPITAAMRTGGGRRLHFVVAIRAQLHRLRSADRLRRRATRQHWPRLGAGNARGYVLVNIPPRHTRSGSGRADRGDAPTRVSGAVPWPRSFRGTGSCSAR